METGSSSSSPFQKTTPTTPVEYTIGNLPRHRVYRQDPATEPEMVRPIGIRMPIEAPIKLQDGGDRGMLKVRHGQKTKRTVNLRVWLKKQVLRKWVKKRDERSKSFQKTLLSDPRGAKLFEKGSGIKESMASPVTLRSSNTPSTTSRTPTRRLFF
ncbi:hypothetical protein MTR67_011825 [Solanum verrucosum]|uniref:Uncharacterized protein n=1 Tax=Solanum verrucosum TaxID=315347 RepID=A0AAF0QA54_SOLVR|nr:hypothetical protein MTR67_011825 [Solanum verrucosum]